MMCMMISPGGQLKRKRARKGNHISFSEELKPNLNDVGLQLR